MFVGECRVLTVIVCSRANDNDVEATDVNGKKPPTAEEKKAARRRCVFTSDEEEELEDMRKVGHLSYVYSFKRVTGR